jgi:hypothetical protein
MLFKCKTDIIPPFHVARRQISTRTVLMGSAQWLFEISDEVIGHHQCKG